MQQLLWLEGDSGDGGGGTAAGLAQHSLTDPSNPHLTICTHFGVTGGKKWLKGQ